MYSLTAQTELIDSRCKVNNNERKIMNPHTRNVTRVFRAATPAEVESGAEWYRDTREVARAMGETYGTSLAQAAGIIAALSPLKSWGANVNLAHRFMAAGGLHTGYLSGGLSKARAILKGDHPLDVLGGLKVRNFYLSIITSGAEGVCVDRHAYSVAVGTRVVGVPSLSVKRYDAVAERYRRAAKVLSREYGTDLTPAQVQSVTWSLWRRRYWSAGAFD